MWLYILGCFIIWFISEKLRDSRKITGFSSKTIFITGCDTGFGYLAAKRFSSLGFPVIAGCLTKEGADKLSTETGGKVKTVLVDVSNEQSVEEAFVQLNKLAPNGLWAVINNAGLYNSWPVEAVSMKAVKKLFDVNVLGLIHVSKVAVNLVRKTKGRIVNVASVAGRFAMPNVAAYTGTKHAVQGFTDSFRKEMKPWGIDVVIIEPGIMKTNLYDQEKNDQVFEKTYNELDENVKNLYGKEFFAVARREVNKFVDDFAGDPSLVVDAMVLACTHEYPKVRYMIGGDKYLWLFLSYVPTFVSDLFLRFVGRKALKPKALN